MTPTDTDDRHTAETRVQGAKETGDVLRIHLSDGRRADHVQPDVLPNPDEWIQLLDGNEESSFVSETRVAEMSRRRHPDTEVIPEEDSLFGCDSDAE